VVIQTPVKEITGGKSYVAIGVYKRVRWMIMMGRRYKPEVIATSCRFRNLESFDAFLFPRALFEHGSEFILRRVKQWNK